ncbi:MAG: universal stress protein [Rhodanobacteraceae bacterium]
MKSIRKILVATDFSPASRHALDHAQAIAAPLGAEVHVLSVHIQQSNLHGLANFPNLDEIESQLEARVHERMREFLAGREGELVGEVISDQNDAPAILRYADERDIDLIVMGTHARTAASRFFLGSVAAEVLRTAPIPILVTGPEHAVGATVFQRILVPVDFSDTSLDLLKYASALAGAFNARLDVVHVTDPHSLPPYYARDFGEEQQRRAEQAMQKLLAAAAIEQEYTSQIRVGTPDDAIVDLATEQHSDLIIMASANRSRLSQMLLGSTSDRVIRKAPCAVLAWRESVG